MPDSETPRPSLVVIQALVAMLLALRGAGALVMAAGVYFLWGAVG